MATRRSDAKKLARRMAAIEENQRLIMEALGITSDAETDDEPVVPDGDANPEGDAASDEQPAPDGDANPEGDADSKAAKPKSKRSTKK